VTDGFGEKTAVSVSESVTRLHSNNECHVFVQDFMSKSDPYLQFSRQMPDGRLQVVHRTEVLFTFLMLVIQLLHIVHY